MVRIKVPSDWGRNWDALSDVLRDLSWVHERRLIVSHHDVPLANDRDELRAYLDVLAFGVLDWAPGESHELVVAFEAKDERQVRAVAGGSRD